MAENITNASGSYGGSSPSDKNAGDLITTETFRQMLDVLESMQGHNHTFYDDYNTVCECQCQCQCSRGTL